MVDVAPHRCFTPDPEQQVAIEPVPASATISIGARPSRGLVDVEDEPAGDVEVGVRVAHPDDEARADRRDRRGRGFTTKPGEKNISR